MPAPVVLWLLGGAVVVGGVAAAASSSSSRSSSSSGGGDVRLKLLDPGAFKAGGSSTTGEKFMDPIYACNAPTPPKPYAFRPDANSEANRDGRVFGLHIPAEFTLAYLSDVPPNAAARVAAMRARIANPGGRKGRLGTLVPFIETSRAELLKLGSKLSSVYRSVLDDAAGAAQVAAHYGVPVASLRAEANAMLTASAGGSIETIQRALKQWGPIAQVTSAAVQTAMKFATESSESSRRDMIAAMQTLAVIANAIPALGQFIAAAANMTAASWAAADDAERAYCRADQQKIWKSYTTGLSYEQPMPWHAADIYPDTCPPKGGYKAGGYEMTQNQKWLEYVFRAALAQGERLSPVLRAPMQQWWRLAVTHMADPRVQEVFAALGWDNYGGLLASDEQVMLVAAPVAVANGLDVDDFARQLWNRSKGWRAAGAALVTRQSEVSNGQAPYDGISYGTGTGQWTCSGGKFPDGRFACECTIPINAWAAQWGVLSVEAFKLARELRPMQVKLKPALLL